MQFLAATTSTEIRNGAGIDRPVNIPEDLMIDLRSDTCGRPAPFCRIASLVTVSKEGKPNVVPATARTSPSNENQVGEKTNGLSISRPFRLPRSALSLGTATFGGRAIFFAAWGDTGTERRRASPTCASTLA